MNAVRTTGLALRICGVVLCLAGARAKADGTEGLGAPSILIEPGTHIIGAGVGVYNGPGNITLDVPLGVTIEQVIVYWEGFSNSPVTGDNEIIVDGNFVTGQLIGGPRLFFGTAHASTYRADITGLGIVVPGLNIISITGFDFDNANNGAGILVIYDDGTPQAQIGLRDGSDLAFLSFAPPLDATVPQTFAFLPAPFDRAADVVMFIASVDVNRSSIIRITTGSLTLDIENRLGNTDGPEWDTISTTGVIPANATEITFEIISGPGPVPQPASLDWLTASFAILPAGINGTIIIEKDTDPVGGTDFDFSHNILGAGSFTLDDGQNETFLNIPAGTYSVTELDPEINPGGWALSNLVCVDSNVGGTDSIENVATRTATINLEAGETVTCTYTNTQLPGTVVINKLTNPAGGTNFGFSQTVDLSGNFNLNHGGSRTFLNVASGAYTVTENDPSVVPGGYELSSVSCTDSAAGGVVSTTNLATRTASINVDPGETVTCTFVNSAPQDCRMSVSEKGSLLIFSKVDIRWNASGDLIQDTFIDLTNDFPGDVCVQMYFVNGDLPLDAVVNNGTIIERSHPGWNNVDVQVCLTANQPTYWSAATGLGGADGIPVSPFTVLDPGTPPGRPDPEGSPDRVLRGYIVGWAVNSLGEEIRWNHLKGDALIVNYANGSAWEYSAWSSQALTVAHGAVTVGNVPGELGLDGVEYCPPYSLLLLDFYATGAYPFGTSLSQGSVSINTDLTLFPVSVDLRQETDGPITTKASFTVWNENETKLTGQDLCITCWDERLFTSYGVPNHFLRENLQTNKGKAQIDGLASQLCDVNYDLGDGLPLGTDPRDVVSEAAALLGVVAKILTFGAMDRIPTLPVDVAGMNLVGMGTEDALIQADLLGEAPPERPGQLSETGGGVTGVVKKSSAGGATTR